jgi:hypothetical protein
MVSYGGLNLRSEMPAISIRAVPLGVTMLLAAFVLSRSTPLRLPLPIIERATFPDIDGTSHCRATVIKDNRDAGLRDDEDFAMFFQLCMEQE